MLKYGPEIVQPVSWLLADTESEDKRAENPSLETVGPAGPVGPGIIRK